MLRVSLMSDLHLEWAGDKFVVSREWADFARSLGHYRLAHGPDLRSLQGTIDLLLLAGDIGYAIAPLRSDQTEAQNSPCAISYAREASEYLGVPVCSIAGNHEFYRGRSIESSRARMAELAAATDGAVHFLDPGTVVLEIGGERVRVIGATLWTDYALRGEAFRTFDMMHAQNSMNDHKKIKRKEGPWRTRHAADEHVLQKTFIEAELARPHDGPTIVMTHHNPCLAIMGGEIDNLSPAYGSNMDNIVGYSGAALWGCGHTHRDSMVRMGDTLVANRPFGYHGTVHDRSGSRPYGKDFRPLVVHIENNLATAPHEEWFEAAAPNP